MINKLTWRDMVWFLMGWFDDDYGLSRGVIVDSAKQTKKSRGKSR